MRSLPSARESRLAAQVVPNRALRERAGCSRIRGHTAERGEEIFATIRRVGRPGQERANMVGSGGGGGWAAQRAARSHGDRRRRDLRALRRLMASGWRANGRHIRRGRGEQVLMRCARARLAGRLVARAVFAFYGSRCSWENLYGGSRRRRETSCILRAGISARPGRWGRGGAQHWSGARGGWRCIRRRGGGGHCHTKMCETPIATTTLPSPRSAATRAGTLVNQRPGRGD